MLDSVDLEDRMWQDPLLFGGPPAPSTPCSPDPLSRVADHRGEGRAFPLPLSVVCPLVWRLCCQSFKEDAESAGADRFLGGSSRADSPHTLAFSTGYQDAFVSTAGNRRHKNVLVWDSFCARLCVHACAVELKEFMHLIPLCRNMWVSWKMCLICRNWIKNVSISACSASETCCWTFLNPRLYFVRKSEGTISFPSISALSSHH